MEILLGFMTATWVFTAAMAVYSHWRYVKKPWEAMRSSLVAEKELREALTADLEAFKAYVKAEFGLRKAVTHSDEDIAAVEKRENIRRMWSAVG